MKILITENKRYQLAYKVLDDTLSKLHREDYDDNKDKDSIFSNHQIMFKDDNDEIVMWFSEKHERLEVNEGIWMKPFTRIMGGLIPMFIKKMLNNMVMLIFLLMTEILISIMGVMLVLDRKMNSLRVMVT